MNSRLIIHSSSRKADGGIICTTETLVSEDNEIKVLNRNTEEYKDQDMWLSSNLFGGDKV